MEKKWRKTAFCTRFVSFASVASVFLAIERRKKAYFEVKQQRIYLNARIYMISIKSSWKGYSVYWKFYFIVLL